MIPAHCFRLRQAGAYTFMSVLWGLWWWLNVGLLAGVRLGLIVGLITAITFPPLFLAARWIAKPEVK